MYLLSKNDQFLALSTKKGQAEIDSSHDTIKVKKWGYRDTILASSKASQHFYLKLESNLLHEVLLSANFTKPLKRLESAHKNGWKYYKESMKYAKNYSYHSNIDAKSFGKRLLDIPEMTMLNFSNRNFFPLPRELACDTVILHSNLDTIAWLHPFKIFPFFWLDDVMGYKHLYYPFKETAQVTAFKYLPTGSLEISMTYTDSIFSLAKYQGKVLIDTANNLIHSLEAYADALELPFSKSIPGHDSIDYLGLSGSYYKIIFNTDPFNYYLERAEIHLAQRYFLKNSQDTILINSMSQLQRTYSESCENIYTRRLNMLNPLIIFKEGYQGWR